MEREDVLRFVEDNDVKFIRLQFTDIGGIMKNIAVNESNIESALDGAIFDGSSIEGFARVEESDMLLIPDLSTLNMIPWRPQQGRVARFISDVYLPDGTPFSGDPRYILKKTLEKAAQDGYTFDVGPECEFFLFHTDDHGLPTTQTHDTASYFDLAPIDLGEDARREMSLVLEDMGFIIDASHHEVAAGQHEIDFRHDEALKTADNIMTFKMVVKIIAQKHGLHATFMPKPLSDEAGSGMHINMWLYKNGKNIFTDKNDPVGISKEARHFIGGIFKHIKGITALTNPLVNSYKRLVPGNEAPSFTTWSRSVRGPLVRIPVVRDGSAKLELLSPDAACNPYLALSVLLAAGIDGINNGIEPPAEITENPMKMTPEQLK
ncbi:MAG TPA: type I glutamate--ammonia ligase, partial [Ruminiclostridium sp.]|nr:type I glutamate--ammonia ligase [Ruminiclostridium sp.]